jgi:hypothetical protein
MSVPGAPNIWVRPLGTLNQLEFWWRPPVNTGGSAITYYQLTCPAISFVQYFSSNVFQTRISSLRNETEHQFTLAAANSNGLGAPSSFTSVQPGDKPKNNFINSFTMIAPSTATLSWDFTYNQKEGDTKWFVITATPSTPNLSTLQFTALSTATSSLITYLSTDTYVIQAYAVNDSGWQYENMTPPIYVDTKLYKTQPVAAKNVIITALSTTAASIIWSPGYYETYYAFYINNKIALPTEYSHLDNTATFTNLAAASTYVLTINSFNNIGVTTSNPIIITTNTILPTNVTALLMTFRTASRLDIQWTGGIGATSWTFSLNGIIVTPFSIDTNQNVVKFYGLNPDAIYAVVVTATNLGGSVKSPSTNFITLPLPPSNPTNLLLPFIDNRGFSLSFIEGNSPVDVVTTYVFYVNQEVNIPSTFWYSSYTSGTSILVSTLSSYTITTWEKIMTPSTFVYPSPSSMWFSTLISTSGGSSFWYSTFSTISTVNSTYSSIVSLFSSTINISSFAPISSISTVSSVIGSTVSTYIAKTGDEKVVQFNNLSSATAFQLIIQASNTGGIVSSLSTWVSTLAAIPVQPVIISSSSLTPYDFTVVWTGGTHATSYVFTLNDIVTTPAYYSLTERTAKFTNQISLGTFLVVVTAVNVSASISSEIYRVFTPVDYPSQPVQLVTSGVTSSGFTLSWSGGLLSSSYSFLVNGLITTPASYSVAQATVTFTGLLPSTSYIIVVIATNASGTNESNPQTVTTLIAAPTQPTNIQTTKLDYFYFSISWTGGDIASSFSFTLNGTVTQPTAYSISLKTATFSNLAASTTYAVIVTATNSTGSTPSSPHSVTTTIEPPGYPTSLTYSQKTYQIINIYWSGAERVSDYSFTVNGAATVPAAYSIANKTANFSGLIAYNDYTFVVTAINVSGSTSSAPLLVKSRLAPPSQPAAVTGNSITQSSFGISWTMPNEIPLGPTSNMATDFFFTLNGLAVTPSAYSIPGRTASFTGLIAGTDYAVVVTAFNESGTNASTPVTIRTVPSTPVITPFTSVTYNSFVTNWSGGTGATSFTYTLNGSAVTPSSSTSTSATFTGLTAQTTYSVIVTATNSSGSVSSTASSVTTLVAPPSGPTGVTSSSITQTGFTISWTQTGVATSYTFTLNGTPVTPSSVSIGGATATFTGLTGSTGYSVVVTATNASGSASSSPVTVTTSGGGALQVLTQTTLSNSGYGCVFDSAGANFYTCMYRPSEIWKVTYPGLVATRYASWNTSVASNLIGLTMDIDGNLYLTDNARRNMWKITAQDTYSLFASGPLQNSQIGQDGYMYSAGDNRALRISNTGTVTVITPVFTDGTNPNWNSIVSVRMGPDGKLYVVDCNGHRIVKMNVDGSNAITFAGNGTEGNADGTGTAATMTYPWDMCFDSTGNIYFGTVNPPNNYIRKVTPGGVVTTYAGNGTAGSLDGPLRSATMQFNGIVIGPDGNLWFTNNGGGIRIAQFATPLQPMPLYAFTNSPAGPPSQPNSLALVSSTSSGFTISWANGNPATSVSFTINGAPATPSTLFFGGKTAVFTGLGSGASYDVIVTATNSSGSTSSASFTASTSAELPGQPTNLTASAQSTTGFTIGWSGAAGAASYTYKLNGTTVTPSSQSVGSKTATFTGLTPGSTYEVIVTAVNSTGTTASAPYSVSLGAPPTAPTNITGSAISASGFTINWTGGDVATSYTYSLDGTTTTPSSQSVSGKTATFTGLNPNTTYAVVVTATNASGSTSSGGSFQPTSITGANLWLDGADPLGTGTPPAAGASFATWYDKSGNNYNATTYSSPTYIAGGGILLNGSSQYFVVSTYSGTNNNETGFVVVNFNNMNHQNLLMSATTNARELVLYTNQIHLFSANVGSILTAPPPSVNTTNVIEYSLNSTATNIYLNGNSTASGGGYAPVTETSLTIARNSVGASAFLNGKLYEVIIYNSVVDQTTRQLVEGYLAWKWGFQSSLPSNHPYKNAGPSSGGTNITTSNTPSAPTNITGSSISQTGFTLNWSNGAPATSYTFTLNGSAATPISSSVSNKTATFSGLTAGTTYAVLITAVNSFGSTPSASTNIPTVPSQPVSLSSSSITASSFTISWSGGTGATSYTYTNNGSSITPSSDQGVASKTATFSGLTAATPYSIVVNATNSSGTTSSSSISVTTTNAPSQPTGLSSSNVTTTGFTISWSNGNPATSYSYTLNGASVTPSSDQGVSSKTATFSGLSSNTSFNVIVTAINADGSSASSPFTVITLTAPVADPPGVTSFSVPADYILITYEFSGGNDMDTRTRVSAPYTSPYLGWGQSYSDNRGILFFGGDNTGQGFEACYFDISAFKNTGQAPDIQIECRAQWYGTSSTVPLKLGVTLFKGGSMQKSGYSWVNPSASNTTLLFSAGKTITLLSRSGGSTGEYIGTVYYNVNTGTGNVNVN